VPANNFVRKAARSTSVPPVEDLADLVGIGDILQWTCRAALQRRLISPCLYFLDPMIPVSRTMPRSFFQNNSQDANLTREV
jgi:hypothetical protein